MFTFTCPNCGTTIQARDVDRGSMAACPQCGKYLNVPNLQSAPVEEPVRHPRERPGPPGEIEFFAPTGVHRANQRFGSRREKSSGSNFLSFFPALAMTAVTVGLFFAVERAIGDEAGFLHKFTHRGWTPYVALLLTFWSLTILVWRFVNVRQRDAALDVNFFAPESRLDTYAAIDAAIDRIRKIAANSHLDALGWRIRRALEHYRTSWNIREVAEVLQEESEADYEAMTSGYSLVRVFLWTIPILGFIGTVMGVGDAVGSFSNFLSQAQEIDAIKEQLTSVTSGLGTAFDTTFVGLVLSIVVMIALTAVERREVAQLQAFEEYCLHTVVRRLGATVRALPGQEAIPTLRLNPDQTREAAGAHSGQAQDGRMLQEIDNALKNIHGLGRHLSKRFEENLLAQNRAIAEQNRILGELHNVMGTRSHQGLESSPTESNPDSELRIGDPNATTRVAETLKDPNRE